MIVGILAVRFQYRFYVFGHLSKWFTFSISVTRLFDVSPS